MGRRGRTIAAVPAVIALLAATACGDDGEATDNPASGSTEPAPETTDPADDLAGRGPALELPDHTVQVVSAEYDPNVPALTHSIGWEPAPSGATYLRVMIRLEAIEAGRQTEPPAGQMALFYAECEDVELDPEFSIMECGSAALEQTDYLTAEQVAEEDPYGISGTGVLEADTPYFVLMGNPVPEDLTPTNPQLCEVESSETEPGDNCIPVGDVS